MSTRKKKESVAKRQKNFKSKEVSESENLQEIREGIHQSIVSDRHRYHDLLAHAVRMGKKAF